LVNIEDKLDVSYRVVVDGVWSLNDHSLIHSLEAKKMKILSIEEESWRKNSQAIWLKQGNKITKFFYKFVDNRRNMNAFWEVLGEYGSNISGQHDLEAIVVRHFSTFFGDPSNFNIVDWLRVVQLFPRIFSEDEARDIGTSIRLEEIKKVLEGFSKDKSPGLDGWTAEFFLNFFELVGEDILEAVQESRRKGSMSGALNSTFITLIPKCDKPAVFFL